jgi:cell division FtsZ-interacting protein ZapD
LKSLNEEELSTQSPSLKKQKTVIQQVIKEVGVPQEMYDSLKQKLIEKEGELKRVEESIYERD